MALPLCKLSEVALIDEVALNIIGHDSYFVHFRFYCFCCSSLGESLNDASTRHSPNWLRLAAYDRFSRGKSLALEGNEKCPG